MKKLISIFLSAMMTVSVFTASGATAAAYETDTAESQTQTEKISSGDSVYGDFKYTVSDNNEVTITKYTGSDTEVVIPSTIENMPVAVISSGAFFNCSSLTSLNIPASVTNIVISTSSFYNCKNFTDIYVEVNNSNYSSLDGVLFDKNKTKLILYPKNKKDSEYVITDSVISIASYAFYGCSKLKSVNIPNSVTTISKNAFENCSSLTSVTIPESVTSIEELAFFGCSSLTSVTIPDGVTTIGNYAFMYCRNLTSVTIPDSVTSIGESAFESCSSLTSVTIPDSVISIGDLVFFGCSSLRNISVEDNNLNYSSEDGILFNKNKTIIFCYPFGKNDTSSYTIPDSVTNIANGAFGDEKAENGFCSYLTHITIPNSVINIGGLAFSNCKSLTSVTISDGVVSIGSAAFDGCERLMSVTIPDSVKKLGSGAFCNCTNLKRVIMSDSIKIINDSVFSGCSNLIDVTIGKSVTGIGMYAFYGCTSLENIIIPDGVTSIGDYAFSGCINLMYITIPESLTSIGYEAFGSYYNIYNVNYMGTEEQWNYIYDASNNFVSSLFWSGKINFCKTSVIDYKISDNQVIITGCDNTVNGIDIPSEIDGKPVTIIDDYAFYDYKNLTNVTIPDSVTNIGNYSFAGCSNLTSVTMGTQIKRIGDSAFENCGNLANISLPTSVTNIGKFAFHSCRSLKSIRIPENVTKMGNYAFSGCINLTSATIANKFIGVGAFDSCIKLTNLNIGNNVSRIGESAFSGCILLKNESVKIPDGLTRIGSYAFADCINLTSVTIPLSVTNIGCCAFGYFSDYEKPSEWVFNVYGYANSEAQRYAYSENLKFYDLAPVVEVKGISLDKTEMILTKGHSEILTATLTPYDATYKTVTWSTSDSNIATVLDGKVTAVAEGIATIKATTNNGKTAVCVVTVKDIILNKTDITIGVGQSYTLVATTDPEDAETTFTWKSSKKDIATVTSKGKVTGRAVGRATITVKTANGKTATCKVEVKPAPESVAISKTSIKIGVKQKYTLTATLTPTNSATYCTWSSNNTAVATVNSSGVVTGKKTGTAVITVKTSNGKTATCKVTVKKAPIAIALDKTELNLNVDETYTLTKLVPENSVAEYTWSSSDADVAEVSSAGKVTAKKTGTAIITLSSHNGKTAACTVTVN